MKVRAVRAPEMEKGKAKCFALNAGSVGMMLLVAGRVLQSNFHGNPASHCCRKNSHCQQCDQADTNGMSVCNVDCDIGS